MSYYKKKKNYQKIQQKLRPKKTSTRLFRVCKELSTTSKGK